MNFMYEYFDSDFCGDPIFKVLGVRSTHQEKSLIKERLRRLKERAPTNTTVSFTLVAQGKKVKGVLAITGIGKRFRSSGVGNNSIEVFRMVEKKIDKQIDEWKKTRFMNKHMGATFYSPYYPTPGGMR